MKVAHVLAGSPSPDVANGVRKYVYFMAQAQAVLGLELAVFCLTKEPVSAVPRVHAQGFPPSLVPFRVPRALLAELERWRPDLLHLHAPYFPPNATLARWARRAGIPYVVTPHGALSPGEIRQRWLWKLPYKLLFERHTLNGAAFVHAVGAAEDLPAYGVTAPVELAPCGIDLSTVPADLDRRVLAARHLILLGRRIFLFLGRLDPAQKGLDLLLQAFAAASLDMAALVLVGPDFRRGRRKLERLAARLRPSAPVILLGPVYGRERFDVVAGADVFVNTSRWEGMPIAVLEAAATGLPCLLTTPADPLGLLSRGGGAISVEPDVGAIAEGLRRMHRASEAELRRMGERARQIVASEFSWQRSARILADAYARHAGPDASPATHDRRRVPQLRSRRGT
jgi:glycosyltransferase involved in cell wall biosynthesis